MRQSASFSGSSDVTSCWFQRFFCRALTDQTLCGRLIPHRFIQNQRYRPERTSSEGSSAQMVIWSVLRFSLHLAGADQRPITGRVVVVKHFQAQQRKLKVVSDWYACCSLPPGSVCTNVTVNMFSQKPTTVWAEENTLFIRLSINWLKQNKTHLIKIQWKKSPQIRINYVKMWQSVSWINFN